MLPNKGSTGLLPNIERKAVKPDYMIADLMIMDSEPWEY